MTVTLEKKRYDGTLIRNAIAVVGDQFGCVNLHARDDQLNIVKEGAVITLRNVHAQVYKEHIRLEIDKWAKVEPSKEKVESVNTTNDLSAVEYELVQVNTRGSNNRRGGRGGRQ